MKLLTNRQFKKLIYDQHFGILTRNGLDLAVAKLKSSFSFIFLDFNDIHHLNLEFGYNEINERFKDLFSSFSFRNTDIVGRFFSGDEIIIITISDDIDGILLRFKEHCDQFDLTFRSVVYKDKDLDFFKSKGWIGVK